MATDVLAPCVARTSAAMILPVLDKLILLMNYNLLNPLVASHCQYMVENANIVDQKTSVRKR